MRIVSTTNDFLANPDHARNSVEGVQYQYPNGYKNKVQPGVEFIYYRGVLRKCGPRGQAEHFGRGCTGALWGLIPGAPNYDAWPALRHQGSPTVHPPVPAN